MYLVKNEDDEDMVQQQQQRQIKGTQDLLGLFKVKGAGLNNGDSIKPKHYFHLIDDLPGKLQQQDEQATLIKNEIFEPLKGPPPLSFELIDSDTLETAFKLDRNTNALLGLGYNASLFDDQVIIPPSPPAPAAASSVLAPNAATPPIPTTKIKFKIPPPLEQAQRDTIEKKAKRSKHKKASK